MLQIDIINASSMFLALAQTFVLPIPQEVQFPLPLSTDRLLRQGAQNLTSDAEDASATTDHTIYLGSLATLHSSCHPDPNTCEGAANRTSKETGIAPQTRPPLSSEAPPGALCLMPLSRCQIAPGAGVLMPAASFLVHFRPGPANKSGATRDYESWILPCYIFLNVVDLTVRGGLAPLV